MPIQFDSSISHIGRGTPERNRFQRPNRCMSRYAVKQPDPAPDREWADAGLPIGSPNDPALGEAHDQTTGPGGNGLRAAPRRRDADRAEAQETRR